MAGVSYEVVKTQKRTKSRSDEGFTIDDLANRDSVNVRDGNNVNYDIDNLSNRYDSVGGNTLAYDAAGNLTADKDGYQYEYDYENRITKIIKSGPTTVAEFAYDALGRRIKKRDSIADTNNIYYYNDNWQILCDYNDAGTAQYWFAYGNYIDEVLIRGVTTGSSSLMYYGHDHLYSPVLLAYYTGTPYERYEYDAYGNCYIMDASYNPRSSSLYGNLYYFTGRQLDFLDGGNLKIQYNRNRYYDYYTGRWLTHDPLGITPNPQSPNWFDVPGQYLAGLNLWQYVGNLPTDALDAYGLLSSIDALDIPGKVILLDLLGVPAKVIAKNLGIPLAVVLAILAEKAVDIGPGAPPEAHKDPPKCPPRKITCCATEFLFLKTLKLIFCGTPSECKGGDSLEVLAYKLQLKQNCLAIRRQITERCYGGIPEPGHTDAEMDTIRGINNCYKELGKRLMEKIREWLPGVAAYVVEGNRDSFSTELVKWHRK